MYTLLKSSSKLNVYYVHHVWYLLDVIISSRLKVAFLCIFCFQKAFETAVVYLLKAINFSRTKPRYHFIVFNASVLYWQMARPFLRPKYCSVLSQSLHQVVKALDEVDDQDHEWRATLMM